jgi:hypothetical protein
MERVFIGFVLSLNRCEGWNSKPFINISAWKLDEFKNRKVLELVFKLRLKLVKIVEFLA